MSTFVRLFVSPSKEDEGVKEKKLRLHIYGRQMNIYRDI